jgi:hypothetical protein
MTNEEMKAAMENVSDIATQIKWPRDEWGFTSDLRKTVVQIAHKANTPEKSDLVIEHLMLAIAHMRKRKDKDAKLRTKRLQDIKQAEVKRQPLERFGTITEKGSK